MFMACNYYQQKHNHYDMHDIRDAMLIHTHHPLASAAITQYGVTALFNKIATQGAPQMAVDKEANSLSRVYSYYSKFNLRLFYV